MSLVLPQDQDGPASIKVGLASAVEYQSSDPRSRKPKPRVFKYIRCLRYLNFTTCLSIFDHALVQFS